MFSLGKTEFLNHGYYAYAAEFLALKKNPEKEPFYFELVTNDRALLVESLNNKGSFPLRISSANATKSTVFCRLDHIYLRNP